MMMVVIAFGPCRGLRLLQEITLYVDLLLGVECSNETVVGFHVLTGQNVSNNWS